MENDVLYTEPLDQDIKRKIYLNFQTLQRQHSMIYEFRGNVRIKHILRHFRKYFIRFYVNIHSTDMYLSIDKNIRKEIDYYANNLMKIKDRDIMLKIVLNCSVVLRNMNLTKMSYEEIDNRSFSTKK